MKKMIELNNDIKDIRIDEDTDIKLNYKGGKIDTVLKFIHTKPDVKSNIRIKAVLKKNDEFNIEPRVIVERGARDVETSLSIEVLLISEKISVKAIPSMEIMEKDIKAGHSLRISKIREEDIYYLTTKGLSKLEARDILIKAFLENE